MPDVVSMENVPEVVNTDVFKNFVATLKDCGYRVSHSISFCPDYGVPQNRKRLVMLASQLGEINLIEPEYTPNTYKTVRYAIYSMPKIKSGERCKIDPLHFSASLNNKNLLRVKASKQGGTWKDWGEDLQLECHKKSTGQTYASVYGRMSKFRYPYRQCSSC